VCIDGFDTRARVIKEVITISGLFGYFRNLGREFATVSPRGALAMHDAMIALVYVGLILSPAVVATFSRLDD
jgi:hypothetical protein